MEDYKLKAKRIFDKALRSVDANSNSIDGMLKRAKSIEKSLKIIEKELIQMAKKHIKDNDCKDKEIDEINKLNQKLLDDFTSKSFKK